MTLAEKIEQYKQLKKSKKALEKRLAELRRGLLREPDHELRYHGMAVQERDRTTLDEDKVWDLIASHNLNPSDLMTQVPDSFKIEQLYLDGVLTDSDLRYIRKPQLVFALVEVGDEDVQELDDGER